MSDVPEVIEHFFGVYLLYCNNPTYKGRTYIGFTVNPNTRIKQHNRGKDHGGAWKTSNRGPWIMVLIIHGFPNKTSALRFEWAWQHPHISRRLRHLPKKKSNQKTFDYCLTILMEMLKTGPWHRLPLTIRWLDYDFFQKYSGHVSPPLHMPVCCGKVSTSKVGKKNANLDNASPINTGSTFCNICHLTVKEEESISCLKTDCELFVHLICLAKRFCKDNEILPLDGICPVCGTNLLWGELVRKKIGCYENFPALNQDSEDTEDDL